VTILLAVSIVESVEFLGLLVLIGHLRMEEMDTQMMVRRVTLIRKLASQKGFVEIVGRHQQLLQMTRIFEIDNNLPLLLPRWNLRPTAPQILVNKNVLLGVQSFTRMEFQRPVVAFVQMWLGRNLTDLQWQSHHHESVANPQGELHLALRRQTLRLPQLRENLQQHLHAQLQLAHKL
jgi:hypothetical protein